MINLGKGRYILDTLEDSWARAGMEAYADACNLSNPNLAESIRAQLGTSYGSYICIETALRVMISAHSIGRMQEGYSKQARTRCMRHWHLLLLSWADTFVSHGYTFSGFRHGNCPGLPCKRSWLAIP